jgi:hypothetical protein
MFIQERHHICTAICRTNINVALGAKYIHFTPFLSFVNRLSTNYIVTETESHLQYEPSINIEIAVLRYEYTLPNLMLKFLT